MIGNINEIRILTAFFQVLCVASSIAAPPPGSVLPTAIPTTAIAAVSATPTSTPAFTETSSAAAAETSAAGEDDDDIPFCDEL